jgi:hypothetical protein
MKWKIFLQKFLVTPHQFNNKVLKLEFSRKNNPFIKEVLLF